MQSRQLTLRTPLDLERQGLRFEEVSLPKEHATPQQQV